jgi:hypothetical protein
MKFLSDTEFKAFKVFEKEHEATIQKLRYAKKDGLKKIDSYRLLLSVFDGLSTFIGTIMFLSPAQKLELKRLYKRELHKLLAQGNIDTMHISLVFVSIAFISIIYKIILTRNECNSISRSDA